MKLFHALMGFIAILFIIVGLLEINQPYYDIFEGMSILAIGVLLAVGAIIVLLVDARKH